MVLSNEKLFNIGNRINNFDKNDFEFCNKPNSVGIMSVIENDSKCYYVYQTIDMEYANLRSGNISKEWTRKFNNFTDALEYAKIMYNYLVNNKNKKEDTKSYTRKLSL